ncbi:MAG: hypothetical protein FJ095_02920 [Deltaproteobacteria bacterium]|nr:hypothetical protein [Deltaproteobacteria bacterium]
MTERSHKDAEQRLLDDLRAEFPAFRIVSKRGDRLSRVIDRALRVLSLGGQTSYLTRYRTVIGDTLYVPDDWYRAPAVDRLICLRHERVHLRQRRRYGMLGMSFAYLFLPLPIGLAWCRARMEWEAYEETLRATAEHLGDDALSDPALKATMLERFVGPDYLWMWPFPGAIERWFDDAVTRIRATRSSG